MATSLASYSTSAPAAQPTKGSETGITPSTAAVPNVDPVGIFWITFTGFWTVVVVFFMLLLFSHRHLPFLRIRALALTLVSTVMLHLWWITVELAYVLAPAAPEQVEFWLMGILFPFGIALFQAANSQFLHVADVQKRYASGGNGNKSSGLGPGPQLRRLAGRKGSRGCWGWLWRRRYQTRMAIFVTAGMVLQTALTVTMYLISRKFHSTFGIPGTEVTGTEMQMKMDQGRGWEWWPTIVWQFFWAWVFAPIVLWRSRNIQDTHDWRVQTMVCCIAGLPATPMWLIAIYVPGMLTVNTYFLPPQWLGLYVMVLEVTTIIIPSTQAVLHRRLRRPHSNIDAISSSGPKRNSFSQRQGATPSPEFETSIEAWGALSFLEKEGGGNALHPGTAGEGVLTMGALEHVLEKNPEPLREFSAVKDFSGENIAFLTAVQEWKDGWRSIRNSMVSAPSDLSLPGVPRTSFSSRQKQQRERRPSFSRRLSSGAKLEQKAQRRRQFDAALRIYLEFVGPRDAEFPINIGGQEMRNLEVMFEGPARSVRGASPASTDDVAVPFETAAWSSKTDIEPAWPLPVPGAEHAGTAVWNEAEEPAGLSKLDWKGYKGEIPRRFDATVFDAAEKSIKYLVLTNTWPKFVKERTSSRGTYESETRGSQGSWDTYASTSPLVRIKRYFTYSRKGLRA